MSKEDNVAYGISPDEEMTVIMDEIKKNLKEEGFDEQGKEINKEDPRVEGLENVEDLESANNKEDEIAVEEEKPDEAELFKEKYYKEKQKRKNVYIERQRLEKENQELKTILDNAMNNNTELYGKDLYNDLEKIKSIRKQALLGEDADLLLEADEIYNKTLFRINEFEKFKENNKSIVEKPLEQKENDYVEENKQLETAKEWLTEHPELLEGTNKFNPRIQKEVASFIEQLDNELKTRGRANEILTEDYLDVIDEFIETIKVNPPKEGYTTSKVGGVRNNFSNFSNPQSGTMKVTLTEFDKRMAKDLKLTEKEYLIAKIEDMKEQIKEQRANKR